MVDFIVPNYRVTPGTDLYPCECVAMDIVVLQYATPTSKEVHAPLHSAVDLVVLEGGVAFTRDPDTSVGVGVYLVVYKLSSTLEREH